jgi:hypothetical protein
LTPWFLATGFSALVLLSTWTSQRPVRSPAANLPLEEWDILELVAHLKRSGVMIRLVTSYKQGSVGHSVYLTTTNKGWDELNGLVKDPRRIRSWCGVIYCERVTNYDPSDLLKQWGEHGLEFGPFVFYGDAELLEQVQLALAPLVP